jgi:hypothetical protein
VVLKKYKQLKLEVVEQRKNVCSTSSKLDLPEKLPSIEEELKVLAASESSRSIPRYLRFFRAPHF